MGGYTSIDINRVWAQAYALFQSGFQYQLTKEEIAKSEENNKEHLRSFPELDLVKHYFEPSHKDSAENEFISATEMLRRLQRIVGSEIKLNHIMIGRALKQLGFEQQQKYNEKKYPEKGYYIKDFSRSLNVSEK